MYLWRFHEFEPIHVESCQPQVQIHVYQSYSTIHISTRLPSCVCHERTNTRLPREFCKQMYMEWFQYTSNLQSHKMVPGHRKKSTCENTFNTWNYTNGNLQKIHNLDIVLAGLTTTSRSEHVLHSSSLFLIDFFLGTSRGASLFTVASPQHNRAASWRLISWSARQAQQNMFDQPEFDYLPQFNFN